MESSFWTAGEQHELQASQYIERHGQFSMDGRWLAYQLHENEAPEVYVIPYPQRGRGRGVRVSNLGRRSNYPAWSRNGSELYFGNYNGSESRQSQVYITNYAIEDGEFVFHPPATPWTNAWFHQRQASISYDVDPRKERVLVRRLSKESQEVNQKQDHFVLFENFFDYLREKVPTDPK